MGERRTRPEDQLGSTITASDAGTTGVTPIDDELAVGQLFAGRYRIVRFIGHGGMGDVREAEDLSLRHHVALKTIRAERAGDSRAIERFRKEALLARRVTHRNVCRVFDVGFHGREMFLTMELLEGETLSARVKRDGAIPIDDALPIVEQIVAALGEAHRAGVVHRDLKCSNVMLCGDRVVVTDFGLAYDASAADHERSREGFLGSPAYVAPEQVAGRRVTFAADVYALGVVMYEMVTSQLPFVGATPMATAMLRLEESPPSPRKASPSLPAAWERVILRCLQREPDDRFASVDDVLAALSLRPVAPPRRQRRQRAWAAAIALVAVVAAMGGVVGWRTLHRRAPGPAATTGVERRTLAVEDLEDRTGGDGAWRATAIAELLAAQLDGADTLRVLPRATAAGHDRAQLLRQGATLALEGTLAPSADGLALTTRVVDLADGRTVASSEALGPPSAIFDLATRAATQLRTFLKLPPPTVAQSTWTRSVLPSNPEAARRYAEGLTALRRFDPAAAQRAFAAALAIEPDQPIVHAAQAQAWHELESEARERDEAKRAFELSNGLPREQRLAIEAAYRETLKDWLGAVDLRISLATFFPDNLDYGLQLAEAQRRAGRADEALATLARLRRLPAPDGDDPRIAIAEANVRARKDKAAALEALEHAVATARKRGAVGVEADARVIECNIHSAVVHVDLAVAACNEAMRLYRSEGNRAGVARATTGLAQVYLTAHRQAETERYQNEALALYRELGSRVGEERVKILMSGAYRRVGENRKALQLSRDAAEFMRAAGEPQWMIKSLDDVAGTLSDLARYEEALPIYRQVIAGAHEQGMPSTEANAMSNLSMALTRRGRFDEAIQYAQDAVEVWKKLGQKNDLVTGLDAVTQIKIRQGRYEEAEAACAEALAARQSLGWIGGPSRQNMAEIALARGDVARAEALARKTVEEFHAQEPGQEQYGLDVLTRVLIRANKLDEATAVNERAAELGRKTGSVAFIASSVAMIKGYKGDVAGALAMLTPIIADAEKHTDLDTELDARTVLTEVLLRNHRTAEARRALATTRKRAAAFGYKCVLDELAMVERELR